MQETFSIVINGPGCLKRKAEIDQTAKDHRMSRSEFFLWLYGQYVARKGRQNGAEVRRQTVG